MVEGTLSQYAPDEEFGKRVRKVVEGIQQVPWESIWLAYEGSAYACLKSLEPELTLAELMGLSGGAFRFFWHPEAGPGMCNLLFLGEETARHTFAPFGYGYTYLADYARRDAANTQERYQRLFVESIDAGRPVVAIGVVGPPDPCVVTGYDQGGAVLYGRSYFQALGGDFETTESGYFRVENWYPQCFGLIAPHAKGRVPARQVVLREALTRALELARGPRVEFVNPVRSDGGLWLHSGLAAYGPLADEFLNEPRFVDNPEDDIWARWAKVELMMFNGLWLLLTTRGYAAEFLAAVAQEDVPGVEHLARAAASYTEEAGILRTATEHIPLEASGDHCAVIAKPEVRQELRRIAIEAKEREARAVGWLEQGVAALQ